MSLLYFSGVLLSLLILVFANDKTEDHPPYFVETPPRLVVFRKDDSVSLQCRTAGTPPITMLWKKNGVNLNASNIIRQNESAIRISLATQPDEGFYQCIAKNKYGVTVSDVFQLQRAVLQPIGSTQLENHLEVLEDQPFVIPASTFRIIPRSRSTEQHVWMKYAGELDVNPERIVPDGRIQIAENGDLHFAYANSSDDLGGRLYLDAVYHPYLNSTIKGNYTRLTVKSNPSGDQVYAPNLTVSSLSRSPALEGENVTLQCLFSGKEEPSVTWLLGRGNLPLGRYTQSSDGRELTLLNVTASDEMSYFCWATNSKGEKTHEIALKVEASPRFVKVEDSPQKARFLEKENLGFRCDAFAKPEATVVWFVNGQSLDENPSKRFAISADRKSLTVYSVCKGCKDANGEEPPDAGVIQCNSSNVHGYALGTGYFNVITMNKGEVTGSSAQENSVPFEVAFVVILSTMLLISF